MNSTICCNLRGLECFALVGSIFRAIKIDHRGHLPVKIAGSPLG